MHINFTTSHKTKFASCFCKAKKNIVIVSVFSLIITHKNLTVFTHYEKNVLVIFAVILLSCLQLHCNHWREVIYVA